MRLFWKGSKFMLKPSALSQHTANFNKLLEQVPVPKSETLNLLSNPTVIEPIPNEPIVKENNEKEPPNQSNNAENE